MYLNPPLLQYYAVLLCNSHSPTLYSELKLLVLPMRDDYSALLILNETIIRNGKYISIHSLLQSWLLLLTLFPFDFFKHSHSIPEQVQLLIRFLTFFNMLKFSLFGIVSLLSLVNGAIIPRDDPPFQRIPATGKPDNTYNSGNFKLAGEPPTTSDIPPAVYGACSIDLPFGRLYHGTLKYFKKGQLNTPNGLTDVWKPGVNDFANQSACGIPDNAFFMSKVAIHPYFLKYADLSRKLLNHPENGF